MEMGLETAEHMHGKDTVLDRPYTEKISPPSKLSKSSSKGLHARAEELISLQRQRRSFLSGTSLLPAHT